MKPVFLVLLSSAALTACADSGANTTPILDGQPSAAFHSDLAAYQTLARDQRRFDRDTAGAAVLGAGDGAVLWAAGEDADAAGGAIAGALAGGVAAAANASERREAMVMECLRGRGHPVVG
jgi:hypothetical protein